MFFTIAALIIPTLLPMITHVSNQEVILPASRGIAIIFSI